MSRTKLILCLFVVTYLSVGSTAYCQSKEETKKFLQKKLSYSSNSGTHNLTERVTFKGDKLVYKKSYYRNDDKQLETSYEHTMDLADLNPKRVIFKAAEAPYRHGWIKLCTTDDKQAIFCERWSEREGKKRYDPGTDVDITVLARNADQAVRALRHLIKLCGGKSELFED